jgi:uncharacterized protein (UPF0333 family)
MSKKGDMSINVIIVAAIALVVLIVLIAIFTGKIGIFNRGASDATHPANTGICRYDDTSNDPNVFYRCANAKPSTGTWSNLKDDRKWIDCGADDAGLNVKCTSCKGTKQNCGLTGLT